MRYFSNTSFASPVPLLASAILTANFWMALSSLVASRPPRLAAWRRRCSASTLTPTVRDIFASSSLASSERLTNRPRPVIPATETMPVFREKIDFVTPLTPFLTERNARLVLSRAIISILILLIAIFSLRFYLKICNPAHELYNLHLLDLPDCLVQLLPQLVLEVPIGITCYFFLTSSRSGSSLLICSTISDRTSGSTCLINVNLSAFLNIGSPSLSISR